MRGGHVYKTWQHSLAVGISSEYKTPLESKTTIPYFIAGSIHRGDLQKRSCPNLSGQDLPYDNQREKRHGSDLWQARSGNLKYEVISSPND